MSNRTHTNRLLSAAGVVTVILMVAVLSVCGIAPVMMDATPDTSAMMVRTDCSVATGQSHQRAVGEVSPWASAAEHLEFERFSPTNLAQQTRSRPPGAVLSTLSLPLRA